MLRINEIKLPLDHSENDLADEICGRLRIKKSELKGYKVFKRSYDARKKDNVIFVYSVDADISNEKKITGSLSKYHNVRKTPDMEYKLKAVAGQGSYERPVVVGSGPCGLFAGLILAQAGFRPLIIERGKPVKERSQDTFGFWREGNFNPDSNVQFGEGGAGTFSDGKLNTQIRDPENYGRKVLKELVSAEAPDEILYVSKPHVGTFRLVKVVENIRRTIIELGGEYLFEKKADQLILDGNELKGILLDTGEKIISGHVVFAVGHSARDTFRMLHGSGVKMEPKPFSVGFRIEHPQQLINQSRIGDLAKDRRIGAADYKLFHHCSNGRTVYSFCMCPGGRVVAATSEPGCVVTNGMSQYSRSEQNANSAIVVGVNQNDFPVGALGGMEFQEKYERKAFDLGGGNYYAPAQLLGDFLECRASADKGSVIPSYQPGVKFTDLSSALPDYVISAIKEAIPAFDRQINGFALKDAVLTGVETRTSSPVRILRDDNYQSLNIKGLYPGGEGAGYAGGIVSAAIDGIKIAEAVSNDIMKGK